MRAFAADDSDTIARRIAELEAERKAMLAGCDCPVDDFGYRIHTLDCQLRQPADAAVAFLKPWPWPMLPVSVARALRGELGEPTGCADDCTHPSHRHRR